MSAVIATDARFWSKVEKTDTCWLWQAHTTNGYGRFSVDGRGLMAHRYSYETLVGPIPDGLHLDHLCRVRNCVRPDHLEPVTCRENLLRGETIQAYNAAKTHCDNGHEFTPENTRQDNRGFRECRTCRRIRAAQRNERDKVARAERRAKRTWNSEQIVVRLTPDLLAALRADAERNGRTVTETVRLACRQLVERKAEVRS